MIQGIIQWQEKLRKEYPNFEFVPTRKKVEVPSRLISFFSGEILKFEAGK